MTTVRLITTAFTLCFALHFAKAEETKESPDPTTIAELTPEPIPQEQNAAVHLERITGDLESFGKAYGAYINSPDGEDFESRIGKGQPPTTEQLAAVRNILDDHAVIFEAIEKAAACDAYGSQLDFTLPPQEFLQQSLDRSQHIRNLGRAVHWKVMALLAEQKNDEAMQLGTRALRIIRFRENEPLTMNFLLTTAVHGIVVDALKHAILAGPTSPDVRFELLAELKAQENSWLPKVLQSERAYAQQTSTDQVHAARGPGGEIAPQLIEWQAKEMSAMDNARKLADKPWHEVRDQFPPNGNMNAALAAAFRTEARRVMYVRCLQILLALQQYKARTGEDATELKYLGIPDASLVDPFSGNPLHLKSTENGWVVYSVMENGNDDGGNFDDMLDWGLAPPGYDR